MFWMKIKYPLAKINAEIYIKWNLIDVALFCLRCSGGLGIMMEVL